MQSLAEFEDWGGDIGGLKRKGKAWMSCLGDGDRRWHEGHEMWLLAVDDGLDIHRDQLAYGRSITDAEKMEPCILPGAWLSHSTLCLYICAHWLLHLKYLSCFLCPEQSFFSFEKPQLIAFSFLQIFSLHSNCIWPSSSILSPLFR